MIISARLPFVFTAAGAIVAALFWLMHMAVAFQSVDTDAAEPLPATTQIKIAPVITAKPLRKKTLPPVKTRTHGAPLPPTAPPTTLRHPVPGPVPLQTGSWQPGEGGSGIATKVYKPTLGGDREMVPEVRVQPIYPRSALEQGIEGWVQLDFDISATGKTQNIRVRDARPKGMFEMAAKRAVARWRYKPTVVDGVPRGTTGLQVQLNFKLD